MKFSLFTTFFFSLTVSLITVPLIANISRHFGFFDQPGKRKVHTRRISRLGGVAIFLSAVGPIVILVPFDRAVLAYMTGVFLIFTMGVWDDFASVRYRTKFLVQILASVLVVAFGEITLEHSPSFNGHPVTQLVLTVITIVFFVGVTNAVNFSDGLDGLAGGLSLLSLGGFAYLGYLGEDLKVVVIAIALMGGIYGFLRFNAYPAKIFMGDGGSQVLGFSLATLAILITQSPQGAYPFPLSLLILGLPVLDTVGIMLQRCVDRRLPFLPDTKHIHHKLMTIGLNHKESVILIYFVQFFMLLVGVWVRSEGEWMIWGAYTLFVIPILILFFLSALDRLSWVRLKRDPVHLALSFINPLIKKKTWLKEKPLQLLQWSLVLFMAVSVSLPFNVTLDLSIAALFLFVLVLLGMTLMRRAAPFLIRLGLYIGSTFLIYLNTDVPPSLLSQTQKGGNLFFVLVAFLVIVNVLIEFNREHPFQVTSLDYLIMLAIISVAFCEIEVAGIKVGLFAAKLTVIFAGFELILNRFSRAIYRFGFIILGVLFVIGVRGWIV